MIKFSCMTKDQRNLTSNLRGGERTLWLRMYHSSLKNSEIIALRLVRVGLRRCHSAEFYFWRKAHKVLEPHDQDNGHYFSQK